MEENSKPQTGEHCLECPYAVLVRLHNLFPWINGGMAYRVRCGLKACVHGGYKTEGK